MRIFHILLPAFLFLLTTACNSQSSKATAGDDAEKEVVAETTVSLADYSYDPPVTPGEFEKIEKPDSYWAERLSPQAFEVLRNDGTERSFTSPLNKEKRAGVFTCAACGLPLFTSDTKFDSGTGWPSFYQPIRPEYIKEDVDNRYGMRRVEVSCARCNGHQGHVFEDGPQPTGLRYCINGVSLDFVPAEVRQDLIDLRMEEQKKAMEAEMKKKEEMDKGE